MKVAELSRFRSAKEVKAAMEGIADGTIDIVVGTHKLLSADVKFKRLGLLVIDEEHRFGVRHKGGDEGAARRRGRAHAHRHADPAHAGHGAGRPARSLRDRHAPQRRLAIKTFVRNESSGTIREAVLRELKRGGQVYFLHNEVETIAARRDKLAELLPEARIAIAHGQMPERELESVMRDFVAQRHNLLLCSTIIETGIDVPAPTPSSSAAPTSSAGAAAPAARPRRPLHHQAYAYLLVPTSRASPSRRRSGWRPSSRWRSWAGFYLAMHDLEIRGAGEVLGENQSGNMMEVGFQLYNDMLAEAVRSLKAGREPDLLAASATTEINLHAPALLPDAYCGDVHVRLSLYKRLATAERAEQIDAMLEEITDRFGKLPPQARRSSTCTACACWPSPYGVTKIDAAPKLMVIGFRPNPPVDALKIIELVQKNRHIKLAGNDKLRIERETPEPRTARSSSATCCARWARRRRPRRRTERTPDLAQPASPSATRPQHGRHRRLLQHGVIEPKGKKTP